LRDKKNKKNKKIDNYKTNFTPIASYVDGKSLRKSIIIDHIG